ncbi:MAG: O-antigen ligase family protein, partial [Chlamydiia bacterium]|nr:O-antigen ligase family protein [Chlamydiia bacterium]
LIHSPLSNYWLLYTRLLQFLTPLFLFSFLSIFVDSDEKGKLTHWIFGSLLIAGIVEAFIGLVQYSHQAPLGLRLLSEPKVFQSCFLSPPDGTKWIFDTPFFHSQHLIFRVTGTLPHANVLGGFLATSLLISSFFFTYFSRWRLFVSLAIPLQFFTLLLTYSRSALFGWILATAFWFAYLLFHKLQTKKKVLLTLIALLFTSATLSTAILYKQLLYRGGILNYENSPAFGADQDRLKYQQKAFEQIKESPFLGSGFGQLSFREKNPSSVHNIYLYLAAEMGLPALVAFLIFLGTLLYSAIQAPPTPHLQTLLALFFLFLFIGCCDFYPILFQQGKLLFFLSAALLGLHSLKKSKGFATCT